MSSQCCLSDGESYSKLSNLYYFKRASTDLGFTILCHIDSCVSAFILQF